MSDEFDGETPDIKRAAEKRKAAAAAARGETPAVEVDDTPKPAKRQTTRKS